MGVTSRRPRPGGISRGSKSALAEEYESIGDHSLSRCEWAFFLLRGCQGERATFALSFVQCHASRGLHNDELGND